MVQLAQAEYIEKVRKYLKQYNAMTAYVANVQGDIEDCRAQLSLLASPRVASLSPAGVPGGGGEPVSQEEREYLKKEELDAKIQHFTQDIAGIEPALNRLSRSIEALNDTDREIVTRRMIHNESWRIIASDNAVSEGYCRRRLPKILDTLAVMMFGPKAM